MPYIHADDLWTDRHHRLMDDLVAFSVELGNKLPALDRDSVTVESRSYARLALEQTVNEFNHLVYDLPEYQINLESFDKALNVGQTIIKAVYRVLGYLMTFLKNFWDRYVSEAASLRGHAEKLAKAAVAITDSDPTNSEVSVYTHLLLKEGEVTTGGDLSDSVKDLLKLNNAMLVTSQKETKEVAKVQLKALKDLAKGSPTADALMEGYSKVHPTLSKLVTRWGIDDMGDFQNEVNKRYGLSDLPSSIYTSPRLLGDRVVYAILPKVSEVSDPDGVTWWANSSAVGVYVHSDEDKPGREPAEVLSPDTINQIAMTCSLLLDGILDYKKSIARAKNFIDDTLSYIDKIQAKVGETSSGDEQKTLIAGIAMTKATSQFHSKAVTDYSKYQMQVVRVILDYCQKSLKQYDKK